MIAGNLKSVRQRIARSCERALRPAEDVKLVCVTKGSSIEEIKEVLDAGAGILGENRVQEAILKYNAIGKRPEWHLVGHLQTNKARDAVKIFSLIHSVDSLRIAEEIDRQAKRVGKVQDLLVEVNVSGSITKFGIRDDEIFDILKRLSLYCNINIKGFMTIAPEAQDPEFARPYFIKLRQLRDEANSMLNTQYSILSMGMSGDFEIAIEEGSNMVRIGRAIFRG